MQPETLYHAVRDFAFAGLLVAILFRQEKFMNATDAQLQTLENDTAALVADEISDKAAVSEILTELKAARDAGTGIDGERLAAVITSLEGVHANLGTDTAGLVAAETPAATPSAPPSDGSGDGGTVGGQPAS